MEKDILPGNIAMNENIKLLHAKWFCHTASCSSDHCFISGENPEHFVLSHSHMQTWASAIVSPLSSYGQYEADCIQVERTYLCDP
jgi:hypothetical protein